MGTKLCRFCFSLIFGLLYLSVENRLMGEEDSGSLKALLVGINNYECSPLQYAENDVNELSKVLSSRLGYECSRFLNTETSWEESGQNRHLISFQKKLDRWIGNIHENDSIVLYLTGHGVIDESGELYFAMQNCDGKNFEDAAYPLSEIRTKLNNSPAKNKILILDICHAGMEKDRAMSHAESEEVNKYFADMNTTTTLASSKDNQKSVMWSETKHSLFTYWIIQGLKGSADSDFDHKISIKELSDYTEERVSYIAKTVCKTVQEPIVLNIHNSDRFCFTPKAISLKDMLNEITDLINTHLNIQKNCRVGIPAFSTKYAENNAHCGILSKWIAMEIQNKLGRVHIIIIEKRFVCR